MSTNLQKCNNNCSNDTFNLLEPKIKNLIKYISLGFILSFFIKWYVSSSLLLSEIITIIIMSSSLYMLFDLYFPTVNIINKP